MAKRWVSGGVWVGLMASAMLVCGRTAMAEQPAAPRKFLISDVIILGNQRMTTEQIKKRLKTRIGQEYNEAVVDEDVRELYKTRKFSNIGTFLQADDADRVKVYFYLREIPNLVQGVRPTITVVEGDGVFKDIVITVQEKPKAKHESVKPHD